MTPVQFALAEIRDRIPEEILNIVFVPKARYRHANNHSTVEQQILDKVINSRIRRYVDSQGAQEITIPLSGLKFETHDIQGWSCHIPKERTNGRSITQAISVHVGLTSGMGYNYPMGVTNLGMGASTNMNMNGGEGHHLQQARMLMNANKPIDVTYTANVYLIDENTIYCEDRMPLSNLELRCMVSADSQFSFIQGAYVQDFADMCVLATEAYIARNQKIVVDKAALVGGVELGVIREYIDKYADSDEQFREFIRTKWRKIQRLTDKPRSHHYLSMLVTPGM